MQQVGSYSVRGERRQPKYVGTYVTTWATVFYEKHVYLVCVSRHIYRRIT